MSAYSVVVVLWGIFWAYWFISALLTRSQIKRRQSSIYRWLDWVLMILGFWILLSHAVTFSPLLWKFLPDNIGVKLIGIVILFSSLSFAIWVRIYLGQYWSGRIMIKVDHKLVRTGPYKMVRHPIYSGVLLGVIGSVIVIGDLVALIAFVLILADLLVKTWKEEKILVEEFGPAYIQYKKEVKALIPYIA